MGNVSARLRASTEAARDDDWRNLGAEEAQLQNQHLRCELACLQEQRDRLDAEVEEGRCEQEDLRAKIEGLARTCQEQRALLLTPKLTTGLAAAATEHAPRPVPAPTVDALDGGTMTGEVSSHPLCAVQDPVDVGVLEAKQFVEAVQSEREGLRVMRKSICGSLRHLGADLYSSPAHFFHELNYNAEDNEYDDCCPVLEVSLRPRSILITNNERGFRPKDVLSLCSVAESGKISGVHIGQKGLGFKSVFSCTNNPHVLSGPWRFKLQLPGRNEMSYITPVWLNGSSAEQLPPDMQDMVLSPAHIPKTHIYLPLKDAQCNSPEFMQAMQAMLDPAVLSVILINMRHLRRFVVNNYCDDPGDQLCSTTTIEKRTGGGSPGSHSLEGPLTDTGLLGTSAAKVENITSVSTTLFITCGSSAPRQSIFQVFLCTIRVPAYVKGESSSRDTDTTTIKLAFPISEAADADSPEDIPRFPVYAGLPVTDLGFRFALDCDWVLVTSRESVRDCLWNRFLRGTSAFLLVTLLVSDLNLRERFTRFLPRHTQEAGPWWGRFYEATIRLVKDKLPLLLMRGGGSCMGQLRLANPALAGLVDIEVLRDMAGIQVLGGNDVGPLQDLIQPLSVHDILDSLPDARNSSQAPKQLHDGSVGSKDTQAFLGWVLERSDGWLRLLFEALLAESRQSPELLETSKRKPIFRRRMPYPHTDGAGYSYSMEQAPAAGGGEGEPAAEPLSLVVHCTDVSFRMWRTNTIIIMDARSDPERRLLQVLLPELTPQLLATTLARLHLHVSIGELAATTPGWTDVIWQDLRYLRNHGHELPSEFDLRKGWLAVPTQSDQLMRAAEVALPTLLGVSIPQAPGRALAVAATPPSPRDLPHAACSDPVLNQLKWELFLLAIGCQAPELPAEPSPNPEVAAVRLLPSLTRFSAEAAQQAVRLLQQQNAQALSFLRSMRIATLQDDLFPVGAVCDDARFRGQLLPTITVPPHTKELAEMLNVTVAPSAELVVKGLHLLKAKQHRQVDPY